MSMADASVAKKARSKRTRIKVMNPRNMITIPNNDPITVLYRRRREVCSPRHAAYGKRLDKTYVITFIKKKYLR